MIKNKHLTVSCPYCKSDHLMPMGTNDVGKNRGQEKAGYFGKVMGSYFDAKGYNPALHEEIEYKCSACKKRFFVKKNAEASEKDFDIPFKIDFFRAKKFYGVKMLQIVYLNGVRVAEVENGQSVQLETYKNKNVIVVTSQTGDAFPEFLAFEATEGGSMKVRFAFKFIVE